MEKLVITIAPTGSIPKKINTPHVPITPDEIIESGIQCESAGASVIHIHVRNLQDESPSTDFHLFETVVKGVKEQTSLITQISTGGRAGMSYEERSRRLQLKPEMASLTTGSVNFPNSVYANSPQLIKSLASDMNYFGTKPEIEIFDIGMIQNALTIADKGLIKKPIHFCFVMGLPGAIPATVENLVHLKQSIPNKATWSVAGIGSAQLIMNTHAILMGGHVRVGIEDNIYYKKGELATNPRLIERVVRLSRELGREIATPDEARKILNL
jgi:3-keto-5-aminohexanoate cleavage enzyme